MQLRHQSRVWRNAPYRIQRPKRVNFIAIQQGHGIACSGYSQAQVRTGYEQVVAHRTGDMFATTAKEDGRVISATDKGMVIEYQSGKRIGIELGRRFGNAEGLTIPHFIQTDLKEGDEFKNGAVIAYNTGFFERDVLDPDNVVWKAGVPVTMVFWESSQTLEDASSISRRLADKLTTQTTKVKTVVVDFKQHIYNPAQVGQKVKAEDILCTIADEITSNANLLDEESLNTLRLLGNQTPTAKIQGTIERVEVFYRGDKEDMSDSLRAVANASDKEMGRRYKSQGKPGFTGEVTEDLRIDGEPLAMDTAAIRFYITSDVPAGVGDKGVFFNQMKTVFSEVLPHELRTESGQVIDAVFGQKSIDDRIVTSPAVIGTTNTLLRVAAKRAISIYKGNS
jgi:hypothetical protein